MPVTKKSRKNRNFMYTQQVSHLPNNMSPDDVYNLVDSVLKPKRWAGVLHDHDVKEDGTPAEDNVHVMMQFENGRSVNQIAKELGDNPQYVEIWRGDLNNGFAYLVHATDEARHKHQYSCSEVKANFDYIEYMKKLTQKVRKNTEITSANKINGMLDLIGTGELSLKDAKKEFSGSNYAKYSQKLQRAHELYLERCAERLHVEMEEQDELVNVHWFYGKSETGKTRLAEKLAKESGEYYITTTTKDAFQYYQAEPIIILDEFRPETIPFSEMLAMFNPFSRGKVTASSRYYNKPLACRTFFITTPYSPEAFLKNYRSLNCFDSEYQLYRRLSSVLLFDEDYIHKMEFDGSCFIEVDKKENLYSKSKQTQYTLTNVFDRI